MVYNRPVLVLYSEPVLRLICEYVTVTEELKRRAEFSNLNLIAEGNSAPGNCLEIPKAGVQVLLLNQENRREKKAKASAATSQ